MVPKVNEIPCDQNTSLHNEKYQGVSGNEFEDPVMQ
jgi:hypothetical protein